MHSATSLGWGGQPFHRPGNTTQSNVDQNRKTRSADGRRYRRRKDETHAFWRPHDHRDALRVARRSTGNRTKQHAKQHWSEKRRKRQQRQQRRREQPESRPQRTSGTTGTTGSARTDGSA